MQHLDDALIAEWVDGAIAEASPQYGAIAAHVNQCDECRMRVEEERALAGHVRQLLGVAAPPERVPPFEEVLHRASGTPRRHRVWARGVWVRRLAWAATLVVAGGVGWYARGALMGGPAGAPERVRSVPSDARPAVGAADAPQAPAAVAEQDQVAPDLVAGRPAEESAAGRGAVGTVAREQAGAPSRTQAAAAADEGRRELASAERQSLEDRVARRDAAPPAAPPTAAEPRPLAQVAAPAENEVQMQKAALEPWTAASRAAAEAVLVGDAPLAMVPDLPVTSIELSADGRAVRVRQDLGGGTVLELVQSRPAQELGRAAGAEAELPRGRQTSPTQATDTVTVRGLRVIGRAGISIDSLRALMAKLR